MSCSCGDGLIRQPFEQVGQPEVHAAALQRQHGVGAPCRPARSEVLQPQSERPASARPAAASGLDARSRNLSVRIRSRVPVEWQQQAATASCRSLKGTSAPTTVPARPALMRCCCSDHSIAELGVPALIRCRRAGTLEESGNPTRLARPSPLSGRPRSRQPAGDGLLVRAIPSGTEHLKRRWSAWTQRRRAVDGLDQRLDTTDLTTEASVGTQGWRDAMLTGCPNHPEGGCRLARHGTDGRQRPAGFRVTRSDGPESHQTFSLLPQCMAAQMSGSLQAVEDSAAVMEEATSLAVVAERARPRHHGTARGCQRCCRRRNAVWVVRTRQGIADCRCNGTRGGARILAGQTQRSQETRRLWGCPNLAN